MWSRTGKFAWTGLATLAILSFIGPAGAQEYTFTWKPTGETFTYRPNEREIVITFRAGASRAGIDSLVDATGLRPIEPDVTGGLVGIFEIPSWLTASSLMPIFEGNPLVRGALPAMLEGDNVVHVIPGRCLVQFVPGICDSVRDLRSAQLGAEIVQRHYARDLYTVSAAPGMNSFDASRAFSDLQEVVSAVPSISNYDIKTAGFWPPDCYFTDGHYREKAWAFENKCDCDSCVPCGGQGPCNCHVDADMRVAAKGVLAAWDYTRGDTNTVIAIIDPTGFRLDHPDLVGNFLPRGGEDWFFEGPNRGICSQPCPPAAPDTCCPSGGCVDPGDTCVVPNGRGHGTECAGAAAATLDPCQDSTCADSCPKGMAGVCPECSILPLRPD